MRSQVSEAMSQVLRSTISLLDWSLIGTKIWNNQVDFIQLSTKTIEFINWF